MAAPRPGIGPSRQKAIYLRGLAGLRPAIPPDFEALEARVAARLEPRAFAYLAGGAGRESGIAGNRDAFGSWRLKPRMLRDVGERDLSVELFGRRLPAPILAAPIGVLELAHRRADRAVAAACAGLGLPMIFSNQASLPMEACAAVMGQAPRWFQLYWSKANELVESLVGRAEACGCEAIVVTLDTTLLGWRSRDIAAGYLPFLEGRGIAQYTSDPVFRRLAEAYVPPPAKKTITPASIGALLAQARRLPGSTWGNLTSGRSMRAVQTFIGIYSRPTLQWEDLKFLRERTRLPILLKGVLHEDDARMALDHGIDGLICSNHGGRQVDGVIPSVVALPRLVEAVQDRIPVLLDSGVRGGADVLKALALGARAVCVGRPYAYGLALAGERGVREVFENLLADLDLTLGLIGCRSIAELGPQMIERSGG